MRAGSFKPVALNLGFTSSIPLPQPEKSDHQKEPEAELQRRRSGKACACLACPAMNPVSHNSGSQGCNTNCNERLIGTAGMFETFFCDSSDHAEQDSLMTSWIQQARSE